MSAAPGAVAPFEQHTEFPHSRRTTPEATRGTSLNANPISATAGGGATASEMCRPRKTEVMRVQVNELPLTARAPHVSSAWDPRPSQMERVETRAPPYGKGRLGDSSVTFSSSTNALISPATFPFGTSTARNRVVQNGESGGRSGKKKASAV